MRSRSNPQVCAASDGLVQVAELLAAGIFRLRQHQLLGSAPPVSAAKTCTDAAAPGLEIVDETVLSVQAG